MASPDDNIISLSFVRREKRPAPCDPMIATLLDHAATVQQVALPLQKSLAALEKDWRPRRRVFWQAQLRALAALQEAVQPCIEILSDVSLKLTPSRYKILCPLFETRAALEQAIIHIRAYLPQCQSHSEKSLCLHRKIVREMRTLASTVEEAARLLASGEIRGG